MIILGVPYGTENYVNDFWKQKMLDFRKEVDYFKSFPYHTLQAKAIISKSKLMPRIGYVGSVLPMPSITKEKINNLLLGYIIPHRRTFLKVENLAARKDFGGIGLANINLHCSIMLIRNVMHYMKMKRGGEAMADGQYFLEYNVGHQLSVMQSLEFTNRSTHTA